jgi:hypothetical protein
MHSRRSSLVACALLAVVSGCSRTDTFYLGNADLADPLYLQKLGTRQEHPDREPLGLYAHRLTSGSGLVLAYRWYSPGSIVAIDDEVFEKLTVWVPDGDLAMTREFEVPTADVSVVFARGGSAWPRAACSGWMKSGSVRLEPKGAEILVQVSGALIVASGKCPPEISFAFHTRALGGFDRLTPWLGAEGDHPYRESYR